MRKLILTCALQVTVAAAWAIDPRVPPIFTGSVMTNETVMFMGTDDAAPLMYKADRILSVTSFDLKTEYKEGVDWTFDAATRTIRPTPNTRMPYFKESEWYPAKGRFRSNRPGKPFVFFSEGSVVSLHPQRRRSGVCAAARGTRGAQGRQGAVLRRLDHVRLQLVRQVRLRAVHPRLAVAGPRRDRRRHGQRRY